jgi:flagellar protein FliO/FliZ
MKILKTSLNTSLLALCLTASALAQNAETPETSAMASAPFTLAAPSASATPPPRASAPSNDLFRAPSASQNTVSSSTGNLLQVISALIVVILVLLACAWAVKNFGPKNLLGKVPVRVVGGVNIGGRERVLVIEVADQWIVIGATPSQITALTTLPRQNTTEEGEIPGKQFSVWLKQMMEKRNG